MRYLCFLIIIFFFISACNSNSESKIIIEESLKNSTSAIDTTVISATLNPAIYTTLPEGIYKATLHAGIEHTIAFYSNNTYKLEERSSGKNPSVTKTSGWWKPTNRIIYLYDDGIVVGRYQWNGDTLQYLKGTTAYAMQKQKSASDVLVWKNKQQEGIEFFGLGNEPFWNIEIDEQSLIKFHLAEWPKPMEFEAVKPMASKDSMLYITKNNTATLKVIIYNTFCSDGMSDNIYDHKVKVVYNNQTYDGCGILYKP